jgi:hypothetical protein
MGYVVPRIVFHLSRVYFIPATTVGYGLPSGLLQNRVNPNAAAAADAASKDRPDDDNERGQPPNTVGGVHRGRNRR